MPCADVTRLPIGATWDGSSPSFTVDQVRARRLPNDHANAIDQSRVSKTNCSVQRYVYRRMFLRFHMPIPLWQRQCYHRMLLHFHMPTPLPMPVQVPVPMPIHITLHLNSSTDRRFAQRIRTPPTLSLLSPFPNSPIHQKLSLAPTLLYLECQSQK